MKTQFSLYKFQVYESSRQDNFFVISQELIQNDQLLWTHFFKIMCTQLYSFLIPHLIQQYKKIQFINSTQISHTETQYFVSWDS